MSIKTLLLLPHIRVHNANALASPVSVGFPALTGFLGAVHALQRKLNQRDFSVCFTGTGIVCHEADLQTYKGEHDFVASIIGTGNPLDKSGERSSFIEEARIHLDISLVIELTGLPIEQQDTFENSVDHILQSQLKMAGGDILTLENPCIVTVDTDETAQVLALQKRLMPGYAVLERRDLMQHAMAEGSDALEALIDYLAVHQQCDTEQDEDGNITKTTWAGKRKTPGWIIPIATGFHGISELGSAKNQRDADTPHRFAESVVTLGEFKMPHRLKNLDELFWYTRYYADANLYLCEQKTQPLAEYDERAEPETPFDEFA